MADPAEIGKYGTIRLLRRREPTGVVAAYPIDDEDVSFGRDASCSVRLYYPEVSPLHCKIVFEERKAFLQVFGGSGVIVDDCPVYPIKSAILGEPSTTVTVPLPNGSIFEIHKKRFMFNYPPKALRPQLFTPATMRRKSIRMSLVQSAQVFSPAPSPRPRENLRVLQSPLKLPSTDAPVRLVDGDHPRVYEEEQDLVILEDIERQLNGYHPNRVIPSSPMRLQTLPPIRQGLPQTPRRRSQPSLHRAVLIRSAQRTAFIRETHEQVHQQQSSHPDTQFEEIDLEEGDAERQDEDSDDEKEEEDEVVNSILDISEESEGDVTDRQEKEATLSSGEKDEEMPQADEQDITEAQKEFLEEENEEDRFTTPLQVSRTLHLGAFKTPQPGLFARKFNSQNVRRKTGPQRPPPGFRFSLAPGLDSKSMMIKEEDMDQDMPEFKARPTSPTKRREISEEERKAILERRKSALKIPDPEIGESIHKVGECGTSTLPPSLPPPTSPFKTLSSHIDEGEDTQVVLQRMQAQVAERRASLSPTRPRIARENDGMIPSSPTKTFSLLAAAARLKSPIRELPEFEAEMMKEMQNQTPNRDSMDVDVVAGVHKSGDRRNVESVDENTQSTYKQLQTPHLDGVRDMFRAPKLLQTPRMDGVHQLFVEQRAQETPDFDGIGDMMPVEKQDTCDSSNDKNRFPDVPEDVAETSDLVRQPASSRKLPLATRTLTRSKGRRPTLIRSRGTPTDASTMADDEATPDAGPTESSKQPKPSEGIPESAVVHRSRRTRRATSKEVDSDAERPDALNAENRAATKSPRRRRPGKQTAEDAEIKEETGEASAKPPSKSRGRCAADHTTLNPDSETGTDVVPQPARRGKRVSASRSEEATPATRRSTRARSRSAEPASDDNAEANIKSSAQPRVTAVETIPEEEEPASTNAQPSRKTPSAIPTRSRRIRMRTDSSAEDAPPKKRAGTNKAAATDATSEGVSQVEDKENTPETSPVSESGDDSSARSVKATSKTRAGTRSAAPSKAKAGLGKTKPPSKTLKTKTEDEVSAPASRSTRARARK
ncbi:hypothetical protein ACEPAF_2894 [Sanghuangporus sanghuang]